MKKDESLYSNETVLISPRLSVERKKLYESIYQQYKNDVYRFLLKQGLSNELTNDILHDVYYRILRQNEPEKLTRWPKAYLLKIAINLLRDKSRRAKVSAVVCNGSLDAGVEISVVELSPKKELQQSQQLQIIKQAISELSSEQRQIFLMHRVDSMTSQEISEEIGMPLHTVQRYLGESLAYCQRKLARENEIRR